MAKASDTILADPWAIADLAVTHARRTLIAGPKGTGKTYTASRGGNPDRVFSVPLDEATQVAELRGHYVPVKGEFVWRDGPVTAAWRHGARLVLDELDKASPEAYTFLLMALNDPDVASFMLPSMEEIRPAEGFHVVATMNGDPDDLPDLLLDRFEAKIVVKNPHPQSILALPQDLQEAAKKSFRAAESKRCTPREWHHFAFLRQKVDAAVAAEMVWPGRGRAILDAYTIGNIVIADKAEKAEVKAEEDLAKAA